MQLSSLDDSNLGITRQEISALFAPFVASGQKASVSQWDQEVSLRKREFLRRSLKHALLGWLSKRRRSKSAIKAEYSQAWSGTEYAIYDVDAADAATVGYTPWLWHGEKMFAVDTGATRFRQLLFCRFIERVKPRSVLEVGCGNGMNLMPLACRFPEIEFTGVELTEAGNRAAKDFQQQAVLPQAMQEFAPLPLADPTAFRRINFLQGNAADLPFDDGEIDLVYSSLALEQMERIRHQALSEFARVAGRHTLMIEPFRDVNASFWPRLYVFRRNYFRGGIDELKNYGLEPILAVNDFPQEAFLKVCAVLSEKKSDRGA
jgi:SAM-dependent methyltransferase